MNAYTRRLTSIESKMVLVDLKPVVYSTRKSVAHAVAIAKTQCRARIHFLEIDMLNLQALGMAFLEIVQFPGKLLLSTNQCERKIPIKMAKAQGQGKPDSCENRLLAICSPDALLWTGTCPWDMRSVTVLKRSRRDVHSHRMKPYSHHFFLESQKRFERPRESTIWHSEVLLVCWSCV